MTNDPSRRVYVVAAFAAIVCALFPNHAFAGGGPYPLPFYSSNITNTEKYSQGTVLLKTSDSVDKVCEWYRKNLTDKQGEKTTADGAHIFSTSKGATVDVEPGNRFDPVTTISLSWDAKKYGAYQGK